MRGIHNLYGSVAILNIALLVVLLTVPSVLWAWGPDTDLSAVSASFWGEDAYDYAGASVSDAGDVNGDGYNDFLIAGFGDDDGGDLAGQVYLILGKASGMKKGHCLSFSASSLSLGE